MSAGRLVRAAAAGGVAGLVLRRLGQGALVMLAAGALAFAISELAGDPVAAMVGLDASPERRAEARIALGLDRPALLRFLDWAGAALGGDLGLSWRLRIPVAEALAQRLPATAELVVVSALFAIPAGLAAGTWAGLRPGSAGSRGAAAASLLGVSVPTFVIGLALIQVFAVELRWLPASGRAGTVELGGWRSSLLTAQGWASILLPALTLALFQLPAILRLARAETAEALAAEHIRFARARGLPERVALRHALRSAAPPVIAATATNLGALVAFSVITETVFQWPGTGLFFLQSVEAVDAPAMAGCLVLAAAIFVAVNLVADLAHLALDPRLRG
ncbi:ABC transporter permease [Albimonas pacifica]|uniref:Peptide/nickel transport system permease protein n=1 Tax=Albimonas pacifica TaxID=1114924 RepID=A0A1I3GC06_9RHOB|nr:ABC transporter permease [Albimonas pacifica]SFI20944.1 peptide/nickel transport system permease protein [Albimonas pacifica]